MIQNDEKGKTFSLPRLRTIQATVMECKRLDPDTSITEFFVRQLCVAGAPFVVMNGTKYLINLDQFFAYLNERAA